MSRLIFSDWFPSVFSTPPTFGELQNLSMVIQNSDAAGVGAHSRQVDYPTMTISPRKNQLPATRWRLPTEIEHDDEISTKTDASEEGDRVHDNAHRKGTSLWNCFEEIHSSLVHSLQYRDRSGALPVWTTAVPKFPRWLTRRRLAGTSLLVVILDLTVVVYFTFYCPFTYSQHHPHHHIHYRRSSRPTTDQEVDRLPIILVRSATISSSSSFSKRDWSLQSIANATLKPEIFGGIEIESLQADYFLREIRADDYERFEQEQEQEEHVPFAYWHQEELSDLHTACRRPKWVEYHFSTCNDFHHFDLSRNYDEALARLAGDEQDYDNYYINRGFYRDVWVNVKPAMDKSKTILKTMRYKYDFNYRDHYNVNREALVMERLTSANNIVDVYGHCATSVLVEAIPFEVEEYVIPSSGYLKQGEVRGEPPHPFSPLEKLEMALEMAESIAVLHGFKDGVIVHNDIQLRQWLRTREGRLKLGDFNRAKGLDWNVKKEQYCNFSNGVAFGNNRSPEEYSVGDLDEIIDVYSLGNNVYGLVHGLWVFYENEDDSVVQDKILSGERPFIDPQYSTNSYAEQQLVEIMQACWTFDPSQRIDIFEVVSRLRHAVLVATNKPVE